MTATQPTERLPHDVEMMALTLANTFGAEWDALSETDRVLIIRDCTEDGGVSHLAEYRRNIGPGNLAEYVKTQRVRFARKDRTGAKHTVTLTFADHPVTIPAKAIIGPFAIHRIVRAINHVTHEASTLGTDSWGVSHVATGLRVSTNYTIGVARQVAAELAALEGWDRVTGPTVTDGTRELFTAAKAIVDRYRHASRVARPERRNA